MRRLALVVLLFLLWAPGAYAWSWPVQGPVLLGFTFDPSHPYAGGQHRGIDVGAPTGTPVAAPASGTISFAGTVPTSGKSVTIETADGYSVTLTHLGSIGVSKGASVGEGSTVGTVGPSGTPELDVPYVYMGVRVTANAQGYLDPLSFLPALPPPVAVSTPAPPPPTPTPAPVADPPQATTTTPAETTPDTTTTPAATDPPPAATTTSDTTSSDTTTSDTTTDAAGTTEPPVSDTTSDAPAPPPEATSGAGDVSAPDTSGPAEPPVPETTADAPAPSPQEATSAPASGPPDTTVPDEGGSTPPPATSGSSSGSGNTVAGPPPGVPKDPPSQPHVAPPVPAPTPHATVINPDPGLDPTAASEPDSGGQVGRAAPDATPAPVADPAPVAADDAFAVHALFPAATFAAPAAVVAAVRPGRVWIVRTVAPIVLRPPAPAPPRAAPPATHHRVHARTHGPGRRGVAPTARPSAHVAVPARHGRALWPLVLLLALACAAALKAVRMISSSSTTSEGAHPVAVAKDPRRGRMAVRERTAAPGPCRRPRRAVRHLRPLSPPQGQRRPHGERDGRARHAGDGVGGSRRRVAS
jgi:hypothetical protein